MMKKKIDLHYILTIFFIAICIIAIIICAFLKIWVFVEFGDMPITEVPSWAVPWLTNWR